MCKHTSFKIGGTADFFVLIKSQEDLVLVLKIVKQENCNFVVLGNGTNLLVKDNGIRGIVAKIEIEEMQLQKQENEAILTVGAGAKNAIIAQKLLQEEIAGFEFAAGIPGTIGGAVYMNAGAYGGEIKDLVEQVTYIDKEGLLHTIENKDCKFDYRYSIFSQTDNIITKVTLKLPYGKKEEIKQKMEENAASRKEKQPIEMPSAGSTFKRGKDFITAKLIDECGLKGYQVGGAQVSRKHAGFVVNYENATAKNVLDLIEQVQKIVFEKTGKQIELEIKVIGE
ncbi:MAG: UDP-N-acetylmuramate dehydrogenase [Clostridia bacterium]|nr:UDP-N-acetylmuramate dehydrogenase [Clostridia bacterium]